MHHEPLSLARFQMHSEDPSFRVRWCGGTRFVLSGEVRREPTSSLGVNTPEAHVEVSLAQRSTPEHAVNAIRKALPRSVALRAETREDGVELVFHEVLVPAAKLPRLRILTTDGSLRTRQLEENKVEFSGAVGPSARLSILCDQRRVTLEFDVGASAQAVAVRVGSNIPPGYRALVDGASVSVWKDADFFYAVA
jgi:hypothetical protein